MSEKDRQGINAYQNILRDDAAAAFQDDWLQRVAQNDWDDKEAAPKKTPPGAPQPKAPAPAAAPPAQNSLPAPPPSGNSYGGMTAALSQRLAKITRPAEESSSKYRRVAQFLILIGSEQAAKVLANLDEDQVEHISREIAVIRGISAEEAAAVMEEFQALLTGHYRYGGVSSGGITEARRLLYAAFGPEKGETLLRRSVPQTEQHNFSFLEDFSGEQIMSLLRDESPAAGAMILSRINPKVAASALSCAEDSWRKEAVRRIGRLGRVAPEVLVKTAENLREKARHIGQTATSNLDGKGALAAILKHTDITFGDKLLGELAESDASLSREIKERLFTLEDVVRAEDRPIQEKLHGMSAKDIALLIKGRPAAFTEKILSNISANRRQEVRSESDFMGAVPKKDAEAAIKLFMEWFRQEREQGAILMIGDELVE